MKVLKALLSLALLLVGANAWAADESGSTEGLLTSKGEYFIQVTPDGQESGIKFVPYWKGGLPKDGGAFDKDTLSSIKDVKIGSKIRVDWKQDEFKRIVKVAVLEQPKPAVVHKPEEEVHARAASGILAGTIVERRPRRLVIRTASGETESLFFPFMAGSNDPDMDAIRKFGEMKMNENVKIEWEMTGPRRTITKIHHAE